MFASDKRTGLPVSVEMKYRVSRRDIVGRWYEVSLERRRESWGAEDIKRSLWRSKVQLRRQSGVDGKAALAAWGMPFSGTGVVGNYGAATSNWVRLAEMSS